jgi:hypothetical protein
MFFFSSTRVSPAAPILAALLSVHLPEGAHRIGPLVPAVAAAAERFLEALIRTGDEAVERHRNSEA